MWIADADLGEVWGALGSCVSDDSVAVIALLDSNPDVAHLDSVAAILGEDGPGFRAVGSALAVDLATMTFLIEERCLFTGFDEIWVCDRMPTEPKPVDVRITGEELVTDRPVPEALLAWMQASHVRVGLGTGYGVNVVTTDRVVVDTLRGTFGAAMRERARDA